MPIHPRIDEPSKPSPSLNVSSFQRSIGNEQCCQVPSMSTNFRSTISADLFFAKSKNSDGFMASLQSCAEGYRIAAPARREIVSLAARSAECAKLAQNLEHRADFRARHRDRRLS